MVPNAITALSETTIQQADIHDLTDIATRIPGTAFPDQSGKDLIRAPEHQFNVNADCSETLHISMPTLSS